MTNAELTATIVAAFLGGGLVAGIAQIMTARTSAKSSEVERVISLVNELQEENARLRQSLRDQDGHIVEIRKRLEELEKCESQHKKLERELQRYIEYLLEGIRVLIRQVTNHDEMPKFDPVSLSDFLLGNVG